MCRNAFPSPRSEATHPIHTTRRRKDGCSHVRVACRPMFTALGPRSSRRNEAIPFIHRLPPTSRRPKTHLSACHTCCRLSCFGFAIVSAMGFASSFRPGGGSAWAWAWPAWAGGQGEVSRSRSCPSRPDDLCLVSYVLVRCRGLGTCRERVGGMGHSWELEAVQGGREGDGRIGHEVALLQNDLC
ncbi:hypothetical protein M427DRAFT_255326 [Gonapodya prolifera JEL478]|uniref:Uncharacterized protein n=1 Tax=Gonapodya prolifera (strain JEL478) TaxID=1344416 RepID=A0A139ALG9_GONPJ|nr:hypothetical protein M427DRAFT_255326 [Gonapodya prolifera JEL478]|eukprot:KXS17619.1 hypothetical protein M427DRAFT_255326 [Gonapodya prolifera JEL478]